jgi:hypothetical protein
MINLGVGQFLKKPYTITDLGTTVERELSGGENKGTTRGDSFTER